MEGYETLCSKTKWKRTRRNKAELNRNKPTEAKIALPDQSRPNLHHTVRRWWPDTEYIDAYDLVCVTEFRVNRMSSSRIHCVRVCICVFAYWLKADKPVYSSWRTCVLKPRRNFLLIKISVVSWFRVPVCVVCVVRKLTATERRKLFVTNRWV